jgi:signal transduction histidine kinase
VKLTRKLSLWIGLGICLVLAVNAWLRLRADTEIHRGDVVRDHDVMGRSLASGVELLWRRDGEARAREIVEELNYREANVRIRWVWPDGAAPEAPLRPDLVPRPGARTRSEIVDDEGVPHVLSYTPVDLPGGRDGAIEMYESLASERHHMIASLRRSAITTAVLVVLCVGLTLGFGIVFVARPLRAVTEKARRIGGGDLSGPVVIAQNDEIRDVGRAMNEMAERLAEARRRIDEETSARMRAHEQLRHADRLRTLGTIASVIAHELGTPLNVVRARGAMIADAELPVERLRELGTLVVEQSDRMSTIIRGLLDFARRDPPDRCRADLVLPVREAVQWLEPVARKHGVTLVVEAEGAAHAWIDARQIQQAVTNLVLNAIQVSARGDAVAVVLTTEGADGRRHARIDVIDRGPGITATQREQIFEPFFTTKGAGEGTGLGLSISSEIVREHGGSIDVESGQVGTRFSVRLPVLEERTAGREAAA